MTCNRPFSRLAWPLGLLLMLGTAAATTGGAADADKAKAKALTKAYNASGGQLFKQFAGQPGNIVFSPYSIGTAMAMTLAGARGATEIEMAKVLQHELVRPEIDAANAAVLAILNGYDRSAEPPTCPAVASLSGQRCESPLPSHGWCPPLMEREGTRCVSAAKPPPSARLLTANALMLPDRGNLISAEYTALLKDKYAAEVFQGARLDTINGWVERKTEGKIRKLFDKLDPNTAAVLLNAVYFKARWAKVFAKETTKDKPFKLSAADQIDVPMMWKEDYLALVKRQGYRAIRLPYQVEALAMVIALPDQVDGLREVHERLDAAELGEVLTALRGAKAEKLVELLLPRFKAEFMAELKQPFKQAGMTKAFSKQQADFSGMSPKERLVIAEIVHRAVIEVAEESTEAAAATGSRWVPISVRPVPEPFHVDRPFLFYLVDDATGAVLFQGRIVDPR